MYSKTHLPQLFLFISLCVIASCMSSGGADSVPYTDRDTSTDDPYYTDGDTDTDSDADGDADTEPAEPNPSCGTSVESLGGTNLFLEYLDGITQEDVDAKVQQAVNLFFGIGTGEPNSPTLEEGFRLYYELPQDNSMAFIWAADSDDIRSEGMSYGMMIAVQMDLKEQFDKLWRFSKTYIQYNGNTQVDTWRYYFRWTGTVNHSTAGNWPVQYASETVPAPDGDEYFAAALYLADQRWGSNGEINYRQDADNITDAMLNNTADDAGHFPLIYPEHNQVVFVPYGDSNYFTDPSYHLPGFYELFALLGPSADRDRWCDIAATSREFLVDAAHETTGLHSDYATFDGRPIEFNSGDGHDRFKYDAWRVIMNMAVDYSWFSRDSRMQTQISKYHAFFNNHLVDDANVENCIFDVDGSNAEGNYSSALVATLASGAIASTDANVATYVSNLWNVYQQSGQWRYYQECVYLLGLLNTAGYFKYNFE